jgi:PAS domain S-box-containing protein
LADHASMLIWVNSPTGCEYVSRPYLDFMGLTFEQVQGMKWSEYVHPEDREAYIGGYLQALEKQLVFEGQFRFRRASGEYRHLKSVGVPRFDAARAFVPQVVLCDIGLPGMNGYEVAARLREQPALKQTLLIALTGYGEEEAILRAKEAGFDYHLVKPVKPDGLDLLLASL